MQFIKVVKNNKLLLIFFSVSLVLILLSLRQNNIASDYTTYGKPSVAEKSVGFSRNFSIQFSFLLKTTELNSDQPVYENLFQTADYNDGIRIEIAKLKDASSQWAIVFNEGNGKVKVASLDMVPSENSWHLMHLKCDGINLWVYVDGIKLKTYNVKKIKFDFSHIMVGVGFKDRYLNGEIKNFIIKNNSYTDLFLFVLYLIFSLAVIDFSVFRFAFNQRISEAFTNLITNLSSKIASSISAFLSRLRTFFKKFFVPIDIMEKVKAFIPFIFLIMAFSILIAFCDRILVNSYRNLFLYMASSTVFILILLSIINSRFGIRLKVFFSGFLFVFSYLFILAHIVATTVVLIKSNDISQNLELRLPDLLAVFQTNSNEAFEFLIMSVGVVKVVIIVLFPAALLYIVFLYTKSIKMDWVASIKAFSIAILILITTIFFSPSNYSFSKSVYAAFLTTVQLKNKIDDIKKIKASAHKALNVGIVHATKGTHLLVIGESANKNHMSAYGYFRETTPWLAEMRTNSNAIFQENAYASFVHTNPSLQNALTSLNQYQEETADYPIALIDLAKKAGYKTFWITEQPRGWVDTELSLIMDDSDRVIKVKEGGQLLDKLEDLIDSLQPNDANLIILHLMGSHADCKKRIEGHQFPSFDSSSKSLGDIAKEKDFVDNILNPYDASIYLTDRLLEDIFTKFVQNNNFVHSFIYFSDHGEDIYGRKFHLSSTFTYEMARIPLFFYFSSNWKKDNPEKFNNLTINNNKIFTTDLLFDTMIDILGISFKRENQAYSLADENFVLQEDEAVSMRTNKFIDRGIYAVSEPYKIQNDPEYIAKKNVAYLNHKFKGKIFSVNNDVLRKLYKSKSFGYECIEFNLSLPKGNIGHYPEYIFDMSIIDFLNDKCTSTFSKYWFDIKIMEENALFDSIKLFQQLTTMKDVNKKSLIESQSDSLKLFSHNWNVSFYVHFNDKRERLWKYCTSEPNELEVDLAQKCADEISQVVAEINPEAISFFYEHSDFIKKYLEPKISKGIKYNTFGLPAEMSIYRPDLIQNIESNRFPFIFDNRINAICFD